MSVLSTLNLSRNKLLLLIASPIVIASSVCLYYYFTSGEKKSSSPKSQKATTPFSKALKLKNEGNDLFFKKKYEEAIEKYSQAIELCPLDSKKELAIFYQNRAACYETLKQYEEVIKDCTKAIEHDKSYIKAYLRRGKAYDLLGNFENASYDMYVVNASVQFANSDYSILLNSVMNKFAHNKALEIVKKRKIYTFQKYMFKNLLNKYSHDPLRKNTALIKEYDSIISDLLNDDSKDEQLEIDKLLLKASIQMYIGKHEEGEALMQKIIEKTEINDYKVNCLLKLAEFHIQLGNYPKVSQLISQAETHDNTNPDIYFMRSQLKIMNKDNDSAVKDLEKAIELNPRYAAAIGQKLSLQYQQALIMNDEIKRNSSLKQFSQTIQKFPEANELIILYFQILLSMNESKTAEKLLSKAIDNDPSDATLLVYKAMIVVEEGDMQKTKTILEQALKLDPKCSFAYEMLSDLCIKLENLRESIGYLDSAINNSTSFEDVKNLLLKQKSLEIQLKMG